MLSKKIVKFCYKIIFPGAGLIAVIFTVITSAEPVGCEKNIWIEAEDAEEITNPLKIATMDGASGEKGVVAVGNYPNSTGYASYDIEIPVEGKYFFWGRCFWDQVCSNSFNIRMDYSTREIRFGEDPLTNQWHWLSGVAFDLTKGKHKLFIWNAEQGSKIDKILLTADENKIPDGQGLTTEWYIDFENGEIPDILSVNTNNWKLVKDEEQANTYLIDNNKSNGKEEEAAFINLEEPLLKYVYRLCFKPADTLDNSFSVYFDYKDSENFHRLRFQKNKATLFKVTGNVKRVMMQKDSLSVFYNNKFNDIAIRRDLNSCLIKINSKTLFKFADETDECKKMGFSVSGGGICIDNISIILNVKTAYTQNFHATGFQVMSTRPESTPTYFDRLKKGKINWQTLKGNWQHTSYWGWDNKSKIDGFEALEGRCEKNDTASIVFGDDFWEDYTLKLAAKANNKGNIGFFFNFQDSLNYYLFLWEKVSGDWKFKILKKVDGIETAISEMPAFPLMSGNAYWYKFEIKLQKGKFVLFIDDKLIINGYDPTFLEGKIGFFTTCTDGAEFDDIQIYPTTDFSIKKQPVQEYRFHQNADISLSYSNWIPSSDAVIKDITIDNTPVIFITKNLFEEVFLLNKKVFQHGVKISTRTSDVPKDINAAYRFSSVDNGIHHEYQVALSCNKASLFKDRTEVAYKEYPEMKRTDIRISTVNNSWEVKLGDKVVLTYKDSSNVDRMNISVGYAGMGKGKIQWDVIAIKDNIEK